MVAAVCVVVVVGGECAAAMVVVCVWARVLAGKRAGAVVLNL